MKKFIFPFLVALSALSLAGAAAFFSVTGLSKMFGGARNEVIIMASALEFAKIITASFLHRYWSKLKWYLKSFLTVSVVTVMIITSAGIYGFLSNAYSTTSGKLQNIDAQIQMIDQKKSIISSEIKRIEENKNMKADRVKSLTNLRSQQESRIDSLYNRRQVSIAKRVESQIDQANKDILTINIEIDTLNAQMQRKYGEITTMDTEILNFKNSDVNGEVGPLKYIAKLTGRDMDSVVNFFIMLLIFVFDPLAVLLVIATNISIENEFGKKKEILIIEGPPIEGEKEIAQENEVVISSKDELAPIAKEVVEEQIEDIIKESTTEEKQDEVMSYISNGDGEFVSVGSVKTEESKITEVIEEIKPTEAQKVTLEKLEAQGIVKNANYMSYLDVLYKNRGVGDLMPVWETLLSEIESNNLQYTSKDIQSFLTICNLFKVTDMSKYKTEKKAYIIKDYSSAKKIISLLC